MNHSPRFKRKCISIGVLQALAVQASMAATVTVDNSGDQGVGCTLRESVSVISGGSAGSFGTCSVSGTLGTNDTINFSVSSVGGLTSQLQITQDVSINPNGSPVSITSLGNDRVFNVILSTVSMNNLTISGGSIGDSDSNPNASEGGAGISVAIADLTLTNSTITGNSAVDDGGGIFIAGRSSVSLINSTVSDNSAGDNGGGIFLSDNIATLSIQNSTISGNSALGLGSNSLATGNGGGLRITSGASASIANSTISNNSNNGEGGGISLSLGELTVTSTTISNNSSSYRGGGISAGSPVSIAENSVISGNVAGGHGGGIYTRDALSITDSQVVDNISLASDFQRSGGGGGIFSTRSGFTMIGSTVSGNSAAFGAGLIIEGVITIEDSIISDNSAAGSFGGLAVIDGGDATLDNVQVLDNTSGARGGGIYFRGSSSLLSISNSTISGNSTDEHGGGINFRYGPSAQITKTMISGNSAVKGGGLYVGSLGDLTLNESTISDNVSSDNGGGISAQSLTTFSFNNSTFSGNSAGNNGGGFHEVSRSDISIVNSTFANNNATNYGGNLLLIDSTVSLSNSLITGGSAPNSANVASFSSDEINFLGVNLIGDDSTTNAESFNFTPPSNVISTSSDGLQPTALDDILRPLADNGGPTLTHALPDNSPAIDAGDNDICEAEPVNNLDQRGEPRPIGSNCDIGAYEADDSQSANTFFVLPLKNNKAVIFEL